MECSCFSDTSRTVEGEAKPKNIDVIQSTKVVKKFVNGLYKKRHTCMVDNCITNIGLFCDLECKGV